MFKTLRNAWAQPELRKKLLYVLFIIIVYRIGSAIPVPYLDANVNAFYNAISGSIFEYMALMSGSAFTQAKLFALSISPYINASIIMQLLCTAIPALENMSKDEDGRKKISQITRIVTVAISIATAYGYYAFLKSQGFLIDNGFFAGLVIVTCYTAGSCLIMWLGEQITEKGIGNGISIILFVNIVSGLPGGITSMISSLTAPAAEGTPALWIRILVAVVSVVMVVAMVIFVIYISNSERRLQVQYAKRVVGRKMYGGQNSVLPLKLNMSGVMPVIFANSILALPATITMFFQPKEGTFWYGFQQLFSPTSWLYAVLFLVFIIAFAYFYIAISFNPIEVSNNLKNQGGFIPGIRPGKPTADYITKILNKVTLMGAFFLAIIGVLPMVLNIIAGGAFNGVAFMGTSVIIVVGVAVETYKEIEAQMTMRHYKGFLE